MVNMRAQQRAVLLAQHAEQQDRHADAGQHDLGNGERPVHQCVTPASCACAWRRSIACVMLLHHRAHRLHRRSR